VTGLTTAAPRRRRRGVPAGALLAGSAAVVVALLSGCGAGQVTETTTIVPPLTGIDGQTADGSLAVRDVTIAYPGPAGYRAGEPVPLLVRVFNNRVDGPAVKLVGVSVRDGGNVVLVGPVPGSAPASASPTGPAAAPGSATASASSGSPGPTPSTVTKRSSATPSPVPSAVPSPTSAPSAGTAAFAIPVPSGGYVLLLPASGSYLVVTGLSRDLTAKDSLTLTFQFDNGLSIELSGVRIGVPVSPASRAPGEVNESQR
jgi:hypothetical protein